MTYGARQSDIQAFNALGGNNDARLSAWVDQQLDWSNIDDSTFESRISGLGFDTLNKTLVQQWTDHHVNNNDRNRPSEQMERLMVTRALHSERQLLESLADFWHNHFSVFLYDFYAQSSFVSWDRDVIRPPISGHPRRSGMAAGHMLGNFRKMLELSSQHVAMQYYLDNYVNRDGSNNENYAREVMELHTMGAENYRALEPAASVPKTGIPMPWGPGGSDISVSVADYYVDDDVYAAMDMLTGWRIKDHSNRSESDFSDTAEFFFYPDWHDRAAKTILGYSWSAFAPAPADILQYFDLIAYHPGTARHIAGKLCRRFISPDPPQSVIDNVANTFYNNRYADDQLERTYRTLLNSGAFKNSSNWGTIIKRPMELLISALRVCGSDISLHPGDSHSWNIINFYMGRAGHRPFYRRSPDGFPMEEQEWLGSNSLLYELRGIDWICDRNSSNQDNAIIPLLRITQNASNAELPSETPNNLASYWLTRILGYEPGGGWQGDPMHTALRDFLLKNPNDPSQWPANQPFEDEDGQSILGTNSWPTYIHERLRGMVKLALASPQFMYR